MGLVIVDYWINRAAFDEWFLVAIIISMVKSPLNEPRCACFRCIVTYNYSKLWSQNTIVGFIDVPCDCKLHLYKLMRIFITPHAFS
jgi:hypothetical protein